MTLVLTNNKFTADIPSRLGSLTGLKTLDLAGNNFYGILPSSMAQLTSLVSLDLARNHLMDSLTSLAAITTYTSVKLRQADDFMFTCPILEGSDLDEDECKICGETPRKDNAFGKLFPDVPYAAPGDCLRRDLLHVQHQLQHAARRGRLQSHLHESLEQPHVWVQVQWRVRVQENRYGLGVGMPMSRLFVRRCLPHLTTMLHFYFFVGRRL